MTTVTEDSVIVITDDLLYEKRQKSIKPGIFSSKTRERVDLLTTSLVYVGKGEKGGGPRREPVVFPDTLSSFEL